MPTTHTRSANSVPYHDKKKKKLDHHNHEQKTVVAVARSRKKKKTKTNRKKKVHPTGRRDQAQVHNVHTHMPYLG
jgi:hypothetical protein